MGALLAAITVAVLTAEWFWWLVAAVVITLAGRWLRRRYLAANTELAAIEAEKRAIAERCDQQHQWVLQGNERGVWGDGTAIMRDYRRKLARSGN